MFKTFEEFVAQVSAKDRPRAFVVGSPPMFRGTTLAGRDIEMQILHHFPGVPLFVEKPVATGPENEVEEGYKIAQAISDSNTICSVG